MKDKHEKVLKKISDAVEVFGEWMQLPKHRELHPKLMFEFTEKSVWNDEYLADPKLAGVYLFANEKHEIYYVGSVSGSSTFGIRFANGYISRSRIDRDKIDLWGKCKCCRYLFVVEMENDHAFVAPALEQFLITYFKASENKKDFVNALRMKLAEEGKVDELD